MIITIYSTKTCKYCDKAKDWFKSRDLDFTVVDVGVDLEAREFMVGISGQKSVPVITNQIDDDKWEVYVGFDEETLSAVFD